MTRQFSFALIALTLAALPLDPARAATDTVETQTAAANADGTAYTFVGTCTDCADTGNATLRLQNYTQGDEILLSNIVSFTYQPTNLYPGAFGAGAGYNLLPQITYVSGMLPTGLPGPADVYIQSDTFIFFSQSDGSWQIGFPDRVEPEDYGTNGTWGGRLTAVPEPASLALLGLGLLGLGAARRRRG